MYNNQIYYTVTESNVLQNDQIATANYTFTEKNLAEAKLYSLWAYGANIPEGGPQCMSAYMMEHRHDRTILLESKTFDYRQPKPAPEIDEPEEES